MLKQQEHVAVNESSNVHDMMICGQFWRINNFEIDWYDPIPLDHNADAHSLKIDI